MSQADLVFLVVNAGCFISIIAVLGLYELIKDALGLSEAVHIILFICMIVVCIGCYAVGDHLGNSMYGVMIFTALNFLVAIIELIGVVLINHRPW